MKIGIIGAGNVATHLVKGFAQAGIEVPVIYSRTRASAELLATHIPSSVAVTDSLDFLEQPSADVYLISVPDQVLPEIISSAKFPAGALVAHTSGTQPLDILASLQQSRIGVFYPLQTFSKEKEVNWRQIPLCIEASSSEAEEQLEQLGQQLSNQVVRMTGVKRRQLHVAAVFACNFTNHLWGVAQELLQKAALPTNLLEPLVRETVEKAFQFEPFSVQTGPAQRRDVNTVQTHLQLLEPEPQYQHLYQVLTQSIQNTAEKSK